MTHKFDVKNKHKLDNEKRRELLPPKQTLINLHLQEEEIMADIGCGIGYFSIPASEVVGEKGKIFAMDISTEMLEEVKIRISDNHISNIEPVLTKENDLILESNKVTFAFISLVLHEADDIKNFLKEVKRIITPNGKIAIVEWEKVSSEFGPPINHRLDRMYLMKLLDELGFSTIESIDIGENFYGIVAQK
ncbi:ubiquinone/menaquinone biosynthesis C-methylase UbiE [Clostridium saccharoperbutylacetonicum]|uniref:Methylase involved in ubiquinone/menaquinone biosynthesis n=1 Tax=Clostridium saccharoperbutylacetonicum N1-4(HMT) TaxID=931276 RepID=M1LYC6_9CLOT|nr:class I SAM-dependent methyltransferase [Clostridium saccharoperbutylacetonicum]AGF58240.1 methylase involved in ubiquinone/menaquinone biosynthesis [Clostridium saccharoperbutylacetonicum N1-4(HMT)]NRT60983.1 ubiquinone/menaquinone biosynthesis C-methylase UbiE [Clostridium saccharoperbutylacetonicum]NSB24296.1 ubiquinone/menaquinone biosynthesis C-methylase UbiE [Clostridium saccharoperbutylacetonicum]NSB43674.1 ubiquinone/menaquinone biosynthesis C-methylase UbiE [Clostridium saccharoperb